MSDTTIQILIAAVPPFLLAAATFWNTVRIHKATNSTATLLAAKATDKEKDLLRLEAENATLKEAIKGKDVIAAVVAGKQVISSEAPPQHR